MASTIDLSRCPYPPLAHQIIGVEALVRHPFFFLTDEMGAAKSAQVIMAAQVLYERNVIDKVLIICPNSVRSVWEEPDLGELRKHLWPTTPAKVWRFHSRITSWQSGPPSDRPLIFTVSNYEYVRRHGKRFLKKAKGYHEPFCSRRTLIVCDESNSVATHTSQQYKMCKALREQCGRVVLMTGTPIGDTPEDLFAQGNLLSPTILDCEYITYFRAKYAVMQPVVGRNGKVLVSPKGRQIQRAVGWQHLDELQQRFAPYVLRRLKKDCLDLPPKLDPVILTATLDREWPFYTSMRDELVVQLSSTEFSVAQQAVTKLIRLAQITGGFIGGIQRLLFDDSDFEGVEYDVVREIGRAKLDVLLEWLTRRFLDQPTFKVVIGCRFRDELHRAMRELRTQFPALAVGGIYGGQPNAEREVAKRLLDPRTAPEGPAAVLMTSAGSLGINLTAAHTFIRLSRNFSLFLNLQADDRLHRIGQTEAVSYYDILAVGPKGQATIDKAILQAVREKHDVAEWTASAWVRALTKE